MSKEHMNAWTKKHINAPGHLFHGVLPLHSVMAGGVGREPATHAAKLCQVSHDEDDSTASTPL